MKVMNFEEIKQVSEIAYNYLANNDLKCLPLGRHFFDNNIYANVETYETKSRSIAKYEAHRKYIDIQVIISGTEKIIVNNLNELETSIEYDNQKDIAFYYDNNKGNEFILNENDCLVLYPNDGHMPSISIDENRPSNVKKIVFKIPYTTTKKIKALCMDVDGTLTDGNIYMGNDGEVFKSFDIKDGYGIAGILREKNIIPVIITGRKSTIVENRCKELKIEHIYQGVSNKVDQLVEVSKMLNIDLSNIAYIGDDLNDLPCINLINENNGLTACPNNAVREVKDRVNFISTKNSGDGAVRELIDWI